MQGGRLRFSSVAGDGEDETPGAHYTIQRMIRAPHRLVARTRYYRELRQFFSRLDAYRLARSVDWTYSKAAAIPVARPRTARWFVVRVRSMDGLRVPVRAETADAADVYETLVGSYHLPPPGMQPRTIIDAGLCTALTLVDYLTRFPSSFVVGIEPQPYYAKLAGQLSRRWAGRSTVIEAALWWNDTEVLDLLTPSGNEYGASVSNRKLCGPNMSVKSVSVSSLVDRFGEIDFLKLDVEGAEREILRRKVDWCTRVKCVKVELHDGYTVAECIEDLEHLGFECVPDARHWACVMGVRSATSSKLGGT
jgi:FkbM family methyltransferase